MQGGRTHFSVAYSRFPCPSILLTASGTALVRLPAAAFLALQSSRWGSGLLQTSRSRAAFGGQHCLTVRAPCCEPCGLRQLLAPWPSPCTSSTSGRLSSNERALHYTVPHPAASSASPSLRRLAACTQAPGQALVAGQQRKPHMTKVLTWACVVWGLLRVCMVMTSKGCILAAVLCCSIPCAHSLPSHVPPHADGHSAWEVAS